MSIAAHLDSGSAGGLLLVFSLDHRHILVLEGKLLYSKNWLKSTGRHLTKVILFPVDYRWVVLYIKMKLIMHNEPVCLLGTGPK